jgi:chromosome segregation ATPase
MEEKSMSKKIESWRKLKKEREDLARDLQEIERKIEAQAREYEPLETEWLKYQILEDPRAGKIKERLQKMKAEKASLREALDQGRKKLKIMAGILAERRTAAEAEIDAEYVKRFQGKAREFIKILSDAADLERELVEIRRAGRKAMTGIDASEGRCSISAWPEVLLTRNNPQRSAEKDFIAFIDSNSQIKLEDK